MNYYKRHLGDFARDCAHLSQGEVGAYNLALDWYYANEKPLPASTRDLYRITRAHCPAERRNSLRIRAFFDAIGRHKRCDAEIAARHAQAEHNRRIAKLGGRPSHLPPDSNTARNTNCSEPDPNPSHKPVTKKKLLTAEDPKGSLLSADVPPSNPMCPQTEIVKLYHATLPELRTMRTWDKQRQRMLRARWQASPEYQSLQWWGEFFAYIAKSDYLTGRVLTKRGDVFVCDLAWIVRESNFANILDGRYENA